MILGHSRETRRAQGDGGEKRERESEKEMMNNVHCHKCKIRIEKHQLDLAARSPVAQLRTVLKELEEEDRLFTVLKRR